MLRKLLTLQIVLVLSLSGVCAMEEKNGDEMYKYCQRLRPESMDSPLPLEYFQELNEAALAGSKEAKEDLKNNSHYITRAGSLMLDGVVWGGTPEANVAIRDIFAQWVPEGEEMYIRCERFIPPQMDKPLPIEYFQALEEAALAGSKKAKKELKHKGKSNPMSDMVVWGGNLEANEAIRVIFKRWAPKEA